MKKQTRVLMILIVILLISTVVHATEYVSGTVKRSDGVVLGAWIGLYYDDDGVWLELDYTRNNEITGYYCMTFGARGNYKVVCNLDLGYTLTETFSSYGDQTINFVYTPGNGN